MGQASACLWSFYIWWGGLQAAAGLQPGAQVPKSRAFASSAQHCTTLYVGMSSFQRRLPHWRPDGRPLFLTWRLHDSLPRHRFFPASSLSAGKAFVAMDRLLDQARTGPLYLARPEIASLVVEAILEGRDPLGHYDLHAFVVMANHVHLLITPAVPVPGLLQRLKGTTARRANQMLSLTGRAFWQEESFDRWVRDEREFQRIRAYIEENPVRAGLVTAPEDYPWSSAWRTGCGEPG